MSQEIVIILAVLVLGFVGLGVLMTRKPKDNSDTEALKVVTDWMKQMQTSVETRLDKNTSDLNQRLDRAAQIIGSLQKEMGSITEVGRNMRELLAAPKTRGNFGEFILEELLRQYLPSTSFQMQYKFKNGETVDAIIKLDGNILCIDSKFPMENFKAVYNATSDEERQGLEKNFVRDVKKHIDDIAKKYILPQEKTYDFALMYVPAEAVYYEILRNDVIMDYAKGKRVFLISPQAMYHYIHVLAQALRGRRVNEMAQQVLTYFAAIKQETIKLGRDLDVSYRHVTNAKNAMDSVNSGFLKLSDKVERAAELQAIETKVTGESLPEPADSPIIKPS